VQVKLGETKVLAVATAELVEPYPDRSTEGVLQFFVDLSPMASPAFEPGRPSEAAVELMRLLERVVRKSQAVDVESLCVVAGKNVWSIRCDVTVLDHRGNLTDACVFAAVVALKHLRLPAVEIDGAGEQATVRVLTAEQADGLPLVFHHTPVAVSLAFFRPTVGSQLLFVIDPTDREELVSLGVLTVVVNQHQEVCALHKPGGLPMDAEQLMECVHHASVLVPQRLSTLEAVLRAHAERLAAAAEVLRRTGRKEKKHAGGAAGPAAPLVAISTELLQPAHQPAAARQPAGELEGRVQAQAAPVDGAAGVVQAGSAAAPQPHAAANGAAVDKEAAATSAAGAAAARKAPKAKKKKKRERPGSDEEETVVVRSAFDTSGTSGTAAR